MGRTFLVTGGAGFIGANLCARLAARGDRAVVLDNFYTGSPGNLAPLGEAVRVIRHDVTEPWRPDVGIDGIFNLACPASPVHYQRDPVFTTRTCVLGMINMLELATQSGVPVLQCSTSEVYGDPAVHPQPESYRGSVNPIGLRSCYDEGKRCAETLAFDYFRQHGTRIRVVRIFNTYGPCMACNDGRVVSNFILQALRGGDITVYGDGRQTRSFCYVDDLVDGLLRMFDAPPSFIGPVNLGNPGEFTMLELAELVLQLTGSRSKIVHRELPSDDPVRRRPDIALARRELGWEPVVELAEGLRRTIDYFRKVETK